MAGGFAGCESVADCRCGEIDWLIASRVEVVERPAPRLAKPQRLQYAWLFCITRHFFCDFAASRIGYESGLRREAKMERSIALWASLIVGFLAGSTGSANAVTYCHYADYPANCVVRPGAIVAPSREPRRITPLFDGRASGLIRQDLFDRNNLNNLRSDWPSPPAQPGQF
jgi:hypothetical protein